MLQSASTFLEFAVIFVVAVVGLWITFQLYLGSGR